MAVRNYSNTATSTTLTSAVTAATTVIAVSETTGFPAVPFYLTLDLGEVTEEVVYVTNASGTSLTVTRGADGTAAVAHDAGSKVDHAGVAADLREPNFHIGAVADVHGLSGGDTVAGAASVASAQAAAVAAAASYTDTHEAKTSGVHGVGDLKVAAYLPGEIKMYGGLSAPSLWLPCDGSSVSRSTYADLFAVIGTTYGSGDGSATFNLPDLTDRVPMGGGTLGATGGSASVTLDQNQMPAHAHSAPAHNHTINHDHPAATTGAGGTHDHVLNYSTAGVGGQMSQLPKGSTGSDTNRQAIENDGSHSHTFDVPTFSGYSGTTGGTTSSTGGGAPIDITPPHTRLLFIIYAGV